MHSSFGPVACETGIAETPASGAGGISVAHSVSCGFSCGAGKPAKAGGIMARTFMPLAFASFVARRVHPQLTLWATIFRWLRQLRRICRLMGFKGDEHANHYQQNEFAGQRVLAPAERTLRIPAALGAIQWEGCVFDVHRRAACGRRGLSSRVDLSADG